jgi:copper chaperone CopZ
MKGGKIVMRKKAYVICLICITAFLVSCASESTKPVLESSDNTETRTYQVFGMDCPGCQSAVEKLINKIPGVLDSEANWKEKQIIVRIQNGADVSDDDIFDAIHRANFTPGKRIE